MMFMLSEELILFGFREFDSRMLKVEEERGSQNVFKFNN